jgi:SAM-dependent methyltransferase
MSWLSTPSLLRLEEHRALRGVVLRGNVLDLGGDKNSDYLTHVQGEFAVTSVNLQRAAQPDVVHDLEKPLPFADSSYDGAVLFNVLEHIFEYRALLEESARVLKPGGVAVIAVPFLFPVHASPQDFHRFTAETLRRELERAGFAEVAVRVLGGGVFAARYALLDRLLPKPLRLVNFYTWRYVAYALDAAFAALARALGKRYAPNDYALGYLATAVKK